MQPLFCVRLHPHLIDWVGVGGDRRYAFGITSTYHCFTELFGEGSP